MSSDLGFAVAPRLNAAGRLTDMSIGIRCLLADDADRGTPRSPPSSMRSMRSGARSRPTCSCRRWPRCARCAMSASGPKRSGVCLFDAAWHQGVVGLVAGRVKEQLRRPVVAFALADERNLRGSARSVPGRAHPRRARGHGHARARDAGEIRRPCHGRGPEPAARATRSLCTRLRRRGGARHGAERTERCHRNRRRTAARARSRCRWPSALRAGGPWGAAFAEPLFDGVFEVRGTPRVLAERHLKFQVVGPRRPGRIRGHRLQQRRPAASGPAADAARCG